MSSAPPLETSYDLVVIGSGIAGGSLATAASRQGLRVLVLEKSLLHQDRVRGEFMPVWGVQEARRLGVLDVFLRAGGHCVTRSIGYGEGVEPARAEAGALALDRLVPGIPGALTFGHPQVCTALGEAAVEAGATLLRGVSRLEITPGQPPHVEFVQEGQRRAVVARLVVGADGRGSAVARGIGAQVQADQARHLLCGLLVDGAHGWPQHQQSIGSAADFAFYVFPQGAGRVRLYACFQPEQRARFTGPGNAQRLLDAFRLACLPGSDHLAASRAAGPCHGYPGGDTWIERLGAPGIVLIGDAAGHNCPTIGQGVSIALRDARHVVEALTGEGGWSDRAFAAYAEERRERLRRLRFVAQLFVSLRAEFGPQAQARRMRAFARIAGDPQLARPLLASQLGPFAMPPTAFTPEARERLLA